MSIYALAAELGKAIKADERMIRMEKAKKLLSDTDMLVKDIASAVGYDDSRVFVKRFKSNVGMTPVEYRKQS